MQQYIHSKSNISRNTKFNLPPQNLLSLKQNTRNSNNTSFQTAYNPTKNTSNKLHLHKHSTSLQTDPNSTSKKFPSLQLNRPFREIKLISFQSHYNPSFKDYNRSRTPTLSKKNENGLQVSKDELQIIKSLKSELQTLNEKNWKLQKELNACKLNKYMFQCDNINPNENEMFFCKNCNELQHKWQSLKEEIENLKILQMKEETQYNKRIANLTHIITQQKNEITFLSNQLSNINSNSYNLLITQEINLAIHANNAFSFPEILIENQINKITFLLVKTFLANGDLPKDIIQQTLEKIDNNSNIETFTHEINSKYNLNNVPLINSYVYSLGLIKNKLFSIELFKKKVSAIFNNNYINQLSFNSNFNINNEIKMNCISDIMALCIKFDPHYQGYIHFELFTNIIMNYMNTETITSKGYEYLVYTMKKCSADNYDNDLFMVYYRALMPIISQIGKIDNNSAINKEQCQTEINNETNQGNEEEKIDWNEGTLIKMIPLKANDDNEDNDDE